MMRTATCRSMHHQQMCYFWMRCCGDAYSAAAFMRSLQRAFVPSEEDKRCSRI